MHKIYCLVFLIGFSYSTTRAQNYFNNPSFENMPNQFINDWTSCNPMSSFDIQPGEFGVIAQPSDGNSYFSIVARGNMGPYANNDEDVQLKIKKALQIDSIYILTFDVATSPHFGHWVNSFGWLAYNNPVVYEVWGSYSKCGLGEHLYTSNSITNHNWEQQEILIKPQTEFFNFLQIKIKSASGQQEFGNLLFDNFHIKDSIEIFEPIIPNIFTPNTDGINDFFVIEDLKSNANLKVYNRWGKLVYANENYNNNWNGNNGSGVPLAEAVYFYTLEHHLLKRPISGFIHLQR